MSPSFTRDTMNSSAKSSRGSERSSVGNATSASSDERTSFSRRIGSIASVTVSRKASSLVQRAASASSRQPDSISGQVARWIEAAPGKRVPHTSSAVNGITGAAQRIIASNTLSSTWR